MTIPVRMIDDYACALMTIPVRMIEVKKLRITYFVLKKQRILTISCTRILPQVPNNFLGLRPRKLFGTFGKMLVY